VLKKVYQRLQQLLPTGPCAICQKPVTHGPIPLCNRCRPKLPIQPHVPLELKQRDRWDEIFVPFQYREPLAPLIHQLKFNHKLHLSRLFGLLIQQQLQQRLQQQPFELPDQILPIPLHPKRLRQRGFNQALEMIRIPAKTLGIPINRHGCRRVRFTPDQHGLDAQARRENLNHAFTVTQPLKGAHIALFDDVVTTGSTMEAVTKALKQAGVRKIQLWALAYTPPHQ
jgi:ComF family protein